MTHCEQILKWLTPPGRTITSMQALNKFGCWSLSSRISNLKDAGHKINTEFVYDKKTKKTYAKYSLQ